MAQVYAFQISLPLIDTLPRNRQSNTLHFEHAIGGLQDAALQTMCQDLVGLYQTKYGNTSRELVCKAYDTDAVPNYPRAAVTVNPGVVWTQSSPPELALVLSYAANNRGNKSERGRMYLNPAIVAGATPPLLRPGTAVMTWALGWYTTANASLPDIGGVDWKFGVWSPTYKKFTQSQQAWVNDDWDIQRHRGLRETTRQTATREG